MSSLFFKYYTDVTRYNLAFSILMYCFGNLVECIIIFGSIGTAVSFGVYGYLQNVEYYFYRNGGLIKRKLWVTTAIINFSISAIILLILWNIK